MTRLVYKRPAYKRRVAITADLKAAILAGLSSTSQQQLARQLGISQTAISRVARGYARVASPTATKGG